MSWLLRLLLLRLRPHLRSHLATVEEAAAERLTMETTVAVEEDENLSAEVEAALLHGFLPVSAEVADRRLSAVAVGVVLCAARYPLRSA